MLKVLASIRIFTTQPDTAYVAGDAVVVGGGSQSDQGFTSAYHYNLLVVSNEFWRGYLTEGKMAIFNGCP
jgi:hypothetical protein